MANNSDQTNARLASLGPSVGLVDSSSRSAPTFVYLETTANGEVQEPEKDWRVRISLPDGAGSNLFYRSEADDSAGTSGPGVMAPLKETNGVVFPYTPQITLTYEGQYDSVSTTHSNFLNHFYKGSQVSAIQITGDFTVQNTEEGQYLLAAIYFLRAATRMFFGSGGNAGNPPVIVFLNGYGSHYFPNIPCVVTSFAHTLPNDVDYVPIPVTASRNGVSKNDLVTRLPTTSSITISLNPVYSRSNIFKNYDLNRIASGALVDTVDGRKVGGFL